MLRAILFLILVSFVSQTIVSASTTVLLLKEGGSIEGELLNPDEINRRLYQIRTTEGLEVTLDARQVERIQPREREALIEYNRSAPLSENTIENHLHWAQWCRDNQLPDHARLHWRQILELDHDHTDARQVLGYTHTPAGWVSHQSRLESRGFVHDRGRWRTPYQIQVENILENRENEFRHWRQTIRNLVRRLPNAQAEAELLSIRSPAAYVHIRDALIAERNPQNQVVLLRTLAQMPNVYAIQFVAGWSIRPDDTTEDVRRIAIEELQKRISETPEIRQIMVDTYRSALRPNIAPEIVHLAARALGIVDGYEAVPELIEVLVVVRTEVHQESPQGHSFGSGGSGISEGTRTIRRTEPVPNQTVLSTLRGLTGMNFEFNQAAWREWYRSSQRAPSLNLRRI